MLANTLDDDDWYAGNVRFTTSNGSGTYNALNFQLEKRYADNWGFRAVYALAKKETNTLWFTYTNFCQVGAALNLDCLWGPSEYDRRHNLTLSGRTEIRRHLLRQRGLPALSGAEKADHGGVRQGFLDGERQQTRKQRPGSGHMPVTLASNCLFFNRPIACYQVGWTIRHIAIVAR